MKQLLGKIRSVITGLKIKWEFFISRTTCYSTNREERSTLMRVDSRQTVVTTTENFLFKTYTEYGEHVSLPYTNTSRQNTHLIISEGRSSHAKYCEVIVELQTPKLKQ